TDASELDGPGYWKQARRERLQHGGVDDVVRAVRVHVDDERQGRCCFPSRGGSCAMPRIMAQSPRAFRPNFEMSATRQRPRAASRIAMNSSTGVAPMTSAT